MSSGLDQYPGAGEPLPGREASSDHDQARQQGWHPGGAEVTRHPGALEKLVAGHHEWRAEGEQPAYVLGQR